METVKIINCRTLSQVSVGDNLVLRPLGNAAYAKNTAGVPVKVTRIARKYFYAENPYGGEYKFPIDGGRFYDYDSNYGYLPYPSQEAFDEDTETDRMLIEIRQYFRNTYRDNISSETIREIYRLIEKDKKGAENEH